MRANGKASPLARVTEEASLQENSPNGLTKPEKLVEVETPRVSCEENSAPRLAALTNLAQLSGDGAGQRDSSGSTLR